MVYLLVEIREAVGKAKGEGQNRLSARQRRAFEERYNWLVEQGLQLNPPPEAKGAKRGRKKQSRPKNLLDRLKEHQGEGLVFLHDFKVPFGNNLAERDVRMVKLKQKVSGGFRTEAGAQTFCQMRSYISACRKNGQRVFEALVRALADASFYPEFLQVSSATSG